MSLAGDTVPEFTMNCWLGVLLAADTVAAPLSPLVSSLPLAALVRVKEVKVSYAHVVQGTDTVLQRTRTAGRLSLLEQPCGTKQSVLFPPHRKAPGTEGPPVKFQEVAGLGVAGQVTKDTVGREVGMDPPVVGWLNKERRDRVVALISKQRIGSTSEFINLHRSEGG